MAASKKKSKLRKEKWKAKRQQRRDRRTSFLTALALTGIVPRESLEYYRGMDLTQLRNTLAYLTHSPRDELRELWLEYFGD